MSRSNWKLVNNKPTMVKFMLCIWRALWFVSRQKQRKEKKYRRNESPNDDFRNRFLYVSSLFFRRKLNAQILFYVRINEKAVESRHLFALLFYQRRRWRRRQRSKILGKLFAKEAYACQIHSSLRSARKKWSSICLRWRDDVSFSYSIRTRRWWRKNNMHFGLPELNRNEWMNKRICATCAIQYNRNENNTTHTHARTRSTVCSAHNGPSMYRWYTRQKKLWKHSRLFSLLHHFINKKKISPSLVWPMIVFWFYFLYCSSFFLFVCFSISSFSICECN